MLNLLQISFSGIFAAFERKVAASVLLSFCFILPQFSSAQIGASQDCASTVSVCQGQFTVASPYTGAGANSNEFNVPAGCGGTQGLNAENNSVWYTVTVKQGGNMNFSITPQNINNDYDWFVFDLTNATCADIATNPALVVGCGYAPNTGNNGVTGPNGLGGDPQNQPEIYVNGGGTYAILVNLYSQALQDGFDMDFTASTAQFFDAIPPQVEDVLVNNGCGTDTITLIMGESVLCSSISSTDFLIEGPAGTIAATAASSNACLAGLLLTDTITLTLSPNITSGGTYNLILVGGLSDQCGNSNIPFEDTFSFNIVAIDVDTVIKNDLCQHRTGAITVTPTTGVSPYTYSWLPAVGGDTNSISGLIVGPYSVTITDSAGCIQQLDLVVGMDTIIPALAVANPIEIPAYDPLCEFAEQSGLASEWVWDFGDSTSNSTQNNPKHTYQDLGTYRVIVQVADDMGCSGSDTIEVVVKNITNCYVPNAFSPNGDKKNDEFKVEGIGFFLDKFEFRIFNRWGGEVFRSKSPDNGWDGVDRLTEKIAPPGIYVYRLRYTDGDGKLVNKHGHITLFRYE